MADIRIKDLTTTASSSASDDFIAIDGTTNGTRKLNAFSPTFGGNATVTGTLTVSGATMSVGGGSGSIVSALDGTAGNYKLHLFRSGGVDRWYCGLQAATETGSNAGAPFGITALSDAGAQIDVPLQITRAAGGAVTIVRPTAITNTTASTTTSSGALVVSGGVGVAGAINAGGAIATSATMQSVGFHVPGNGAGRPANTDSYLASTATTQIPLYVSGYTGGGQSADILRVSLNSSSDWFSVKGNGQVSCFATTASTSTSSGALVVSGGVGVAGAVYVGGSLGVTGTITVSGDQNSFFSGSWPRMNFTTNGSSVWLSGATTGAGTVQHDFQNRSTTSLLALYGTGNAVFGGNIKTAAPAGGTAAEWKLGTVASVSPTSPNRTIEVDIGGTIYYIHAKTTNN